MEPTARMSDGRRRRPMAMLIVPLLLLCSVGATARETCEARRTRVTTQFSRSLAAAARHCAHRSSACPDALLERVRTHLRDRAAAAILRRCPFDDVTDTLDPIEADVFCSVLGRCAKPTGHIAVRFLAPGAAPDAEPDVDVGWTGLMHRQRILGGAGFEADLLNCAGDDTHCDVAGPVAATPFGAPLPISGGGISVCATLGFIADLAGTYDAATGDLTVSAPLHTEVFISPTVDQPCPACIPFNPSESAALGDTGTCHGGPRDGLLCRVGALGDPAFGAFAATSADCPLVAAARTVSFDFDVTATTGAATFAADRPCLSSFAGGACWCDGQSQANSCSDDTCNADGVCEAGPADGFCSGQPFRACDGGNGTGDCEDIVPGAGTCEVRLRPCFPDPIARPGHAEPPVDGVARAVLGGMFCMPATVAPAVNTVAGFPGPAAFTLPAELSVTRDLAAVP